MAEIMLSAATDGLTGKRSYLQIAYPTIIVTKVPEMFDHSGILIPRAGSTTSVMMPLMIGIPKLREIDWACSFLVLSVVAREY